MLGTMFSLAAPMMPVCSVYNDLNYILHILIIQTPMDYTKKILNVVCTIYIIKYSTMCVIDYFDDNKF